MGIVKRLDFNPHDGEQGMKESPDGEYVKYEDYAQLLRIINEGMSQNPALREPTVNRFWQNINGPDTKL